jgi:hypothetical protein
MKDTQFLPICAPKAPYVGIYFLLSIIFENIGTYLKGDPDRLRLGQHRVPGLHVQDRKGLTAGNGVAGSHWEGRRLVLRQGPWPPSRQTLKRTSRLLRVVGRAACLRCSSSLGRHRMTPLRESHYIAVEHPIIALCLYGGPRRRGLTLPRIV